MNSYSRRGFLKTLAAVAASGVVLSGCDSSAVVSAGLSGGKKNETRWLRGNMHTHTYWSDGDHFPEMAARWYKDHGYDFLVHTDHNILLEGEKWKSLPAGHESIAECSAAFGADWLQTRPDEKESGNVQVKLKTLEQYRSLLEEPGKFLLIMGEEVTSAHGVHCNAFYVDKVIEPGKDFNEDERLPLIRENMRKITDYTNKSGRNTFPVLNHPNWKSAITAEMIAEADDLKFFEVYNGIESCYSSGPVPRKSTDKIWDVALSLRMSRGHDTILYGLATDDAHNYHGTGHATPGMGWVMVRSKTLSPQAILDAMIAGDFYATTGVILKDVRCDGKTMHIEVQNEPGVEYITEYIGTRRGFDLSSKPTLDDQGKPITNTTRTYSEQIGEVLYSTKEPVSSYKFKGDELYVRARIVSNAPHKDPTTGVQTSEVNYATQRAWCQPVIVRG